jgi:NAD binding domain of 6-phosphogluconate dehydrogenase
VPADYFPPGFCYVAVGVWHTPVRIEEREKERKMAKGSCDIGLAVMGQNLVLNMNDHGYKVAVFNRTTSKIG